MSEIKVDKISPQSGTALAVGDSGDTITIPSGATITNSGTATGFGGGKMLQMVSAVKTDTASITNSSFTDISGLSVTTGALASTSSKVLVMVTLSGGNWNDYSAWRVVDGAGSNIAGFVGDLPGGWSSIRQASGGDFYGTKFSPNIHSLGSNLVDSPASTSAQTYKVQGQTESGTLFINWAYTDSDATNRYRAVSSIVAIEIGA